MTEKTFKNLQMDERYKKLERTLKMVLLRNSESRGPDNSNGTWQSISSINGDNLDTSCTAQSIQSSRLCSEVVSSSLNLRNIMMNKKQFNGSPKNIATSSENQYPTSKDIIDDNAMMPPPRLPGLSLTRPKRISEEMPRSPLRNTDMTQNDHNFSMPRMANAASVSKCNDGANAIQSSLPIGEKDYHCGRSYDESSGDTQLVQVQERIFRKWRVLLNDKGQLIIKGTLDCGKIARSKPVIRRITPTSVQSIFMHTYHLRGNLVDERNELPDYVSGKFCNGFPEDWQNVYQVWRNFVGQGSRLSFRWPTPITDSDDDIKSEITEISNHSNLNKRNKLRSPRKRSKSFQTLSTTSFYVANKENQSENKLRSFCQKQNGPVESPLKLKASNSFSNNRSRDSRFENASSDGKFEKASHETSTENSENDRKSVGNSLKDIIQEDKINLIIENLTNKNCSQEYIQKIVEMFDCMKYVVSYQSTSSENSNSVAKPSTDISTTEKNRSTKRMNDRETIAHNSMDKIDFRENQSRENQDCSKNISSKSNGTVYSVKVRRESINYDSSESGNDYDDSPSKSPIDPYLLANYETLKNHKRKEYKRSMRMNQPHRNSGRNFDPSRRPYVESTPITNNKDYNPNETFSMTMKSPLNNNIRQYPAKGRFMEEHENNDTYHSSICITEDENENGNKKMYDFSVSITEDEHCDVQAVQKDLRRSMKYCPEQKSLPAQSDFRRIEDQKKLMYYPETSFHSHGAKIDRDTSGRKNYISQRSIVTDRRESADISVQMTMNQSIDDFGREHFEDSAQKFQKETDPICDMAETELNSLCSVGRSKKLDSQENFKTSEVLLTKKSRDCQKPVPVSCEIVNINLRPVNSPKKKDQIENNKKAENNKGFMNEKLESKQASIGPKNAQNSESILAETNRAQTMITRSRDKENGSKVGDGKSSTRERNSENVEQTKNPKKAVLAKFGSEENPKKLTGWVPAVICDNEDGDVKYRLIFEGKLLNEAGHVVSRKFTTDFVKRRINSKSIETVDHVFYRLVGEMNDTKHVVPAELIKLCRTGCPSKIDHFCEKWESLVPGCNESLSMLRAHNTSVDCLSLPTSSRGRRILPPLNYWDGERIATKDNKAIYSPGNCQESSIPSSLEKTNEENHDKSNSPPRTKGKRIQDSAATKNKNKSSEKILSPEPSETHAKKTMQQRSLQTSTNGKRKLARKMHRSSSESDEEEEIRFRKRKTRNGASTLGVDTESREKLQNHNGNATSLPSLRQSRSSGSFEKRPSTETKSKMRKRPKVDKDDEQMTPKISKQLTTREVSGVTCTFYNNVPMLDDDLSEDQLSII